MNKCMHKSQTKSAQQEIINKRSLRNLNGFKIYFVQCFQGFYTNLLKKSCTLLKQCKIQVFEVKGKLFEDYNGHSIFYLASIIELYYHV